MLFCVHITMRNNLQMSRSVKYRCTDQQNEARNNFTEIGYLTMIPSQKKIRKKTRIAKYCYDSQGNHNVIRSQSQTSNTIYFRSYKQVPVPMNEHDQHVANRIEPVTIRCSGSNIFQATKIVAE